MLDALRRLFGKGDALVAPFADQVLGQFQFQPELGWKKRVSLGDGEAELIIGSDGERPSEEMLRTARRWVVEWTKQKPGIARYIRSQLTDPAWSKEPDLPNPDELVVESINILWSDDPTTAIIYFNAPEDRDERDWHVTFDGREPRDFAYDH